MRSIHQRTSEIRLATNVNSSCNGLLIKRLRSKVGEKDKRVKYWRVVVFLLPVQIVCVPSVGAFPPYKTTDADTADSYTLELRLGLIQLEREGGDIEYVSPLLRANVGFPHKIELITEFEYRPEEGQFGDGAVGFKWAPVQGSLSFGIETLALLPVRPDDDGIGVESQLLATWRGPNHGLQVHLNAGGFYDPRGSETENGWRASVLSELTENSFRPGFELFAKQKSGQDADVRFGAGVIKDVGKFEIRSALHVGLTAEAPDVVFNIWFSTKLPIR